MNAEIIFNLIKEGKTEEAQSAIYQLIEDKKEELLGEVKEQMSKDIGENETLEEASPKRTVVVRKGRRVVKYKCRPGYRKVPGKRKCVRISSSQRILRSRQAKKSARKRRARRAQISRKRKRSIRRRKGLGIK